MAPITPSQVIGKKAEELALEFLTARGLTLVARNFYCRLGEIDLIMQDKNCLVFVEVRARKNQNFGHAFETVNYYKQQKIIKTATIFLQNHQRLFKSSCRFDIVGVTLIGDHQQVEWLQNAFQ